jgi:hypothetical protein
MAETFVSDTFNRADANGWGTADGGTDADLTWDGGTTDWAIVSNYGVMVTSWGGRVNHVGDSHTEDIEISVDMATISSSDGNYGSGILGRYINSDNLYQVTYERSNHTLYIIEKSAGVLASDNTIASLSSCTIKARFLTVGGNVQILAKVWSGAEPDWQLDHTDSTTQNLSGAVGVVAYNSNTTTDIQFNNFLVTTIDAAGRTTKNIRNADGSLGVNLGSGFYQWRKI